MGRLTTVLVLVRRTVVHSSLQGLVLLPLVLFTSHCSSDDDAVSWSNHAGAAGKGGEASMSGAGAGGAVTSVIGATAGVGGWKESAGAGGGGVLGTGGAAARYCRMTKLLPASPFFQCPSEYCSALSFAIGISDRRLHIFEDSTVQAGHCTTGAGLDAVYFAGIVETTQCFYRAGAFVGFVTWGDSEASVEGCRILSGPVIYGEVPESVLVPSPRPCGELTSYRPLNNASSAGAAGASGAVSGAAAGAAGTAGGATGVAGATSVGRCYRAATATCEPC